MPGKLLLIDDDEDILLGLASYFTDRGYGVDCATEKREAEALLVAGAYSCAVVDMHLARSDSPERLDVLRTARRVSPSTRLVVLTANGSPALEAAALRLGASYLRKPLPLADLERVVAGPPEDSSRPPSSLPTEGRRRAGGEPLVTPTGVRPRGKTSRSSTSFCRSASASSCMCRRLSDASWKMPAM